MADKIYVEFYMHVCIGFIFVWLEETLQHFN